MSYINLRKGITDALAKAGTSLSKAAVQAQAYGEAQYNALAGSKHLRNYKTEGVPVATCGQGDVWRIYDATAVRPGQEQGHEV